VSTRVSSGLRPVRGTAAEVTSLLRGWHEADDPEPLVAETSGSTGRPKRVLLSRAAMRASAEATHARLGGPGQWVLNLPPTYVAGIQVLFRSLLAGARPVVTGDDLAAARQAMTADRGYVSLVPTQLVRALADPRRTAALTTYDAVLVGGGPLDPVVRRSAEDRGIRVVQTYGMSETCGGCVYDGLPLDGVAVKIDADGQVLVAGPVLFDGYEGEPERTAAVLADGWLRTSDLGRLDEDGRLRIEGRVDDVIISGGVKVPAGVVAGLLQRHPGVRAAQVVGVPDLEWGEQVVAVLEADVAPPLDELRDLVTPRTWAPRAVVTVSTLPRLSNGKPDRAEVRRVAMERTAAGA
jgi:O-succinylbenzoic acid--CoA ligase